MATANFEQQLTVSQPAGLVVKGLGLVPSDDIELSPASNLDSEDSNSLPPPPYAPPAAMVSPSSMEKRRSIDNMLYQKMLSLESMVSTIHESVVDQSSTYMDVSTQLKEINDSMTRFQQEASIRLRKKLTGSATSRPSSVLSEFSLDCDLTLEPSEIASCTDSFENQGEHAAEEETIRYQRVCSLLESLITDANSVLDNTPLPEDVALPEEEEDLDEDNFSYLPTQVPSQDLSDPFDIEDEMNDFDLSRRVPDDVVEVKFYCQVTQGSTIMQRHELSQRLVLPLINDSKDIDIDRLSLLPSVISPLLGSRQMIQAEPDSQQILENMVLDNDNSAQKMVISLIYWTFLFTIGSVLFDSALCNMAGFQVMTILNNITGASPPTPARNRSNTIAISDDKEQVAAQPSSKPKKYSPFARRKSL